MRGHNMRHPETYDDTISILVLTRFFPPVRTRKIFVTGPLFSLKYRINISTTIYVVRHQKIHDRLKIDCLACKKCVKICTNGP